MKGDYFQVTYRIPTGVSVEKVQAEKDGSTVDATYPAGKDPWLTIEVSNKAGATIRTAKFAGSEIISVVEGHETLKRAKR